MIFQSPLQQFLLWQLEIVLLKMKDTGERNMIQTSGCLKGVDEATGGAAGKSPSQSNAELASLEPPPPQPNLLQRQVFLVQSKCKNLYKNDFVQALTYARQGIYIIIIQPIASYIAL